MPDDTPALTGYVLAELFQGPSRPGISAQRLGTFAVKNVNLAVATHYRPDFTDLDPAIMELGIPHTARYYAGTFEGIFGRQGYQFEIVGTMATPRDPVEAPRFLDQLDPDRPTTILAWRRRVRIAGSPLYVEARWSPTSPLSIDLRVVEQDHPPSATALMPVLIAISLLGEATGIRRPGRPSQTSRHWTRERFHAAWPAKEALPRQRRGADHVTNHDMARAYGVSIQTLQRYLKEYGRPAA